MKKRQQSIIDNSFLIAIFLFMINISLIFTHPCEITDGYNMNSARIEFDENTALDTVLFTLPFQGEQHEIDEIKFKSYDLNQSKLHDYFEIKFKNLILKTHYDLDVIQLDLIEVLFTCTSKISSVQNTFLLYMTINDVNDKAPEFIGVPYSFTIKELIPVGTVVFQQIRAIDRDLPDKPNSQISFSIVKGPYSDYFEFPLSTKSELAVSKLIQYDLFSKCNLTIKAIDHGSPQLSSFTTIEINIIDIDDKDPIFSKSFYTGLIKRNSLPGARVNMTTTDRIFAKDQDVGINMDIVYMLSSNPENLFEINEKNAQLTLKNNILDLDKLEYNLIVKAIQRDNPLRSALSMINILIVDTNDFEPEFESKFYYAKLNENSEKGTIVTTVKAHDNDKNRIEYSILNNHESPFLIDKHNGIIRVNGRLDYEMKSKYTIQIVASDGKYTDTCTIEIQIINLIDKAPYFEYSNYNFKIKIPNDVYIGQIKAFDVEKTSNLSYALKFNHTEDSKLFCVSQTGVLYICSSVIPTFNYKSPIGIESLTPNTMEDILSEFKQNEYVFNVSVSIYSDDLMTDLETHVECRIQIEAKNSAILSPSPIGLLNSTRMLSAIWPSPSVDSDQFFKDTKTIYLLFGTIGISLLLIFIFMSVFFWIKCKNISRKLSQTRNSPIIRTKNKAVSRHFSFLSQKKRNTNGSCCSRSSSDEGVGGPNSNNSSCKNSTSGISSCLSVCSHSKTMANKMETDLSKQQQMYYLQWEEKPGENGILYGTQYYPNDKSPMSKVTVLSDYTDTQTPSSKNKCGNNLPSQISSMIRNDMNQIKISSYSDILSSTASTLKNRDTPILVRQECIYEPEPLNEYEIEIGKPMYTTFKASPTPKQNNNKIEVNGLGEISGTCNAAFNQHEPLSANSETNLNNSDKVLIYEEPKNLNKQNTTSSSPVPTTSNLIFRNHLDNCNSSLVKLVTISQQISNLAESNKMFNNINIGNGTSTTSEKNTYNTMLNDSSLISESVDNFTGNEDYYDECCFTNTSSRDEITDSSPTPLNTYRSSTSNITNASWLTAPPLKRNPKKEIKISIPFNRRRYRNMSFDRNKGIELANMRYYYDEFNDIGYI